MAYRIRYGAERKREQAGAVWPVQVMMAAALLACLLAVNMLPGGAEGLARVFQPESGSATEAMALELRESGSVREGFVAFCRRVLETAGYGTQAAG